MLVWVIRRRAQASPTAFRHSASRRQEAPPRRALTEARVVIEDFRCEYNHYRPHSKLGYLSPSRFAAQRAPSPTTVGLRPPFVGDGQTRTHDLSSI